MQRNFFKTMGVVLIILCFFPYSIVLGEGETPPPGSTSTSGGGTTSSTSTSGGGTTSSTSTSGGGTTSSTSTSGGNSSVDIASPRFTIDTSLFTLTKRSMIEGTSEQKLNTTLGVIIRKMLIGLGMVSLFFLTIGASYIIFSGNNDEWKSKGKNIIKTSIMALVISLSSYYIVNLVAFILYKQ